MANRILTIMFTDIKGFTERTSRTSRDALCDLLDLHEKLLVPVVTQFKGQIVKTIGDALLVTFESPTNAVLCGLMIQETLYDYNEGKSEEEQIHVRVAINSGEVVLRDGDVFGEAVNIAARIEGITNVDEIYFTESVYLSMNKAEVPSSAVGERRLKGLPEAIRIYRVIQDRNSDTYQKLVQRLKTAEFEDVTLPSTGGIAVSVGLKFRLKPIIMAAGALVILGLLGIVAVKGFKSYQVKAAEKEIAAMIQEGRYDDAITFIESRKDDKIYPTLRVLKKKVLLSKADSRLGEMNDAAVYDSYSKIIKEYPKDVEVLMEVVKKTGADYKDGSLKIGIHAAYQVSRNTKGVLEDIVGRTLIDALKREGPYGTYASDIRQILIKRYPQANEVMRKKLSEKAYYVRVNAYYLCKEARDLDSADELKYHFTNLITLNSAYKKAGEESITYLNKVWKAKDWKDRKKAAGISLIQDVAALHSWSSYQKKVSDVLAKAFLPEIQSALFRWVEGDEGYLRVNAYHLLQTAGMNEKIDWWKFHAKTLVNFDTRYVPSHFEEALSFFREQVHSDRSEEAQEVLKAGRAYLEKQIKAYEDIKAKGWAANAKKNLDKLEKTLTAVNPTHNQ